MSKHRFFKDGAPPAPFTIGLIFTLLFFSTSLLSQTTYEGPSLFTGHMTLKSVSASNPLSGLRNSLYLNAENYPNSSSALIFTKGTTLLGSMGSDLFASGQKNLYLQSDDNSPVFLNPYGGNVSIGSGYNYEKLSVNGNIHLPMNFSIGHLGSTDKFWHLNNWVGSYSLGWYVDSDHQGAPVSYYSSYNGMKFFTQNNPQPRLIIDPNGSVGIGTSNVKDPGYKLFVETGIRTRKIKVDQVSPWPDYVFEPDYIYHSIDSLSEYIQVNKHLPGVPSAKEIALEGLDLGANQALLLKKIEELTLYIIKQQNEIKELQKHFAANK